MAVKKQQSKGWCNPSMERSLESILNQSDNIRKMEEENQALKDKLARKQSKPGEAPKGPLDLFIALALALWNATVARPRAYNAMEATRNHLRTLSNKSERDKKEENPEAPASEELATALKKANTDLESAQKALAEANKALEGSRKAFMEALFGADTKCPITNARGVVDPKDAKDKSGDEVTKLQLGANADLRRNFQERWANEILRRALCGEGLDFKFVEFLIQDLRTRAILDRFTQILGTGVRMSEVSLGLAQLVGYGFDPEKSFADNTIDLAKGTPGWLAKAKELLRFPDQADIVRKIDKEVAGLVADASAKDQKELVELRLALESCDVEKIREILKTTTALPAGKADEFRSALNQPSFPTGKRDEHRRRLEIVEDRLKMLVSANVMPDWMRKQVKGEEKPKASKPNTSAPTPKKEEVATKPPTPSKEEISATMAKAEVAPQEATPAEPATPSEAPEPAAETPTNPEQAAPAEEVIVDDSAEYQLLAPLFQKWEGNIDKVMALQQVLDAFKDGQNDAAARTIFEAGGEFETEVNLALGTEKRQYLDLHNGTVLVRINGQINTLSRKTAREQGFLEKEGSATMTPEVTA